MGAASLTVVSPFFAIMVAGFLVGKLRLLPAGSAEILSRFVFIVAMPALIFLAVSRVSLADFFNWSFIGALGGSMIIMLLLGMLVARLVFKASHTLQVFHGLASMYSSTAYIGLPLLLTVFGDQVLAAGVIGAVITGMIFSPLAILFIEFAQGETGRTSILRPFVSALLQPPIVAALAGLVVSGAGVDLPDVIVEFCKTLGGAFVPSALFAAGLFISGCVLTGMSTTIGWLVLAKLVIHPIVAWWLAFELFALPGILPYVVVIQAALPCGVPVFVLAQHYRRFVSQSSAIIGMSTALSVVSLPILLLMMNL